MVNSITHNSDFIKEISVTSQVIEIINLIFETAFTGFPAVEGQVKEGIRKEIMKMK